MLPPPKTPTRASSVAISWLLFVPLLCAVILTLRDQMFWEASDLVEGLELLVLWLVLVLGWLWQLVSIVWKKKRPTAREAILPCALALLFATSQTQLPLRVLFRYHKGALAQALKRSPQSRYAQGAPLGFLTPLQISKSKRATRILLWEGSFIANGTVVGFAHCPHNTGCRASTFEPYFVEGESVSKTIPIYKDWVAMSISGTDF